MAANITTLLYSKYFDALLAGDRRSCQEIMAGLLQDGTDIREIYQDLLQRALYEVGSLWETNKISVAEEHMASAITESLLTLAHPVIFAAPHIGRRAVVSCVANEYHQLGGKMIADIMEMAGWDTYFLGANTPADALYSMLSERKPHLLCLSVAISGNMGILGDVVREVARRHPQLPVFVGGQAFARMQPDAELFGGNVRVVSSIQELELQMKAIA